MKEGDEPMGCCYTSPYLHKQPSVLVQQRWGSAGGSQDGSCDVIARAGGELLR